jgi:DNA-binding transcriptional regulator GbsR (MarR family)
MRRRTWPPGSPTACYHLAEPDFQQRVTKVREDIISRVIGKLSSLGIRAAATLGKLLNSADEDIRLKAAKEILANLVTMREHAEISERLAALEASGESNSNSNGEPRTYRQRGFS